MTITLTKNNIEKMLEVKVNETIIELINEQINDKLEIDLEKIVATLQSIPDEVLHATEHLKVCNHPHIYFWNEFANKISNLDMVDCTSYVCKAGSWKFPAIYHRGLVLVFMKEDQFANKRKKLLSNTKQNCYIRNIASALNLHIPPVTKKLFQIDNDELILDEIREKVTKILTTVYDSNSRVEGFGLILFTAYNNEIASARLVIVDGNLNICGNGINLNKYLKATTPVIVEKSDINLVADESNPRLKSDPTGKVKLRQNAIQMIP